MARRRLLSICANSLQFNVTELYDQDATRESILRWFGRLRPHPDDRVLFYFAGHGITRPIGKRTEGYLALADSDGYWNSLAMEDILDEAEALPAKHALFLLDACFSGLALRGRSGEFEAERTAEYLLTRKARYAITAGGEEVVDDDMAGEYSLFTHYLLNGLADPVLAASGILRAKTLGLYLEENVSANRRSRALPNHGYLAGSGDGDFVFSWERGPRLPVDLQYALRSDVGEVRWGAVAALIKMAKDEASELAPIARDQLEVMARDDPDKRVRKAAQSLFDEEEALRQAEEERIKQEEADARLEAARQAQEEAERAMREAEARMTELRRRAEENQQLSKASKEERQQALERALRARQITPIRPTTQDVIIKPPKQVEVASLSRSPLPWIAGAAAILILVIVGLVFAPGLIKAIRPPATSTDAAGIPTGEEISLEAGWTGNTTATINGRITGIDATQLEGRTVEVILSSANGFGLPGEITRTGTVPDGAEEANVGVRINLECDCSGPADVNLYEARYSEGTTNLVPNPNFTSGTEFWGFFPGLAPAVLQLSDRDTGHMLVFSAADGQPTGVNGGSFKVTAGASYEVTFTARISPSSVGSGFFGLFFLELKYQ